MPAEIVFSDGVRMRAVMTDAETLRRTLNYARMTAVDEDPSAVANAASGWARVETETEGVIYVNPAQVAYVRDVPDKEILEHTIGIAGV